MLLRGSGQHTGDDYDLTAIVEDGVTDAGVAAGAALVAYADAFFEGGNGFAAARDRLEAEVGEEASVDAAATLAIFNAVVRIADSTGIPLEEAKAELSADLRGDLGLDDWSNAEGQIRARGV